MNEEKKKKTPPRLPSPRPLLPVPIHMLSRLTTPAPGPATVPGRPQRRAVRVMVGRAH